MLEGEDLPADLWSERPCLDYTSGDIFDVAVSKELKEPLHTFSVY